MMMMMMMMILKILMMSPPLLLLMTVAISVTVFLSYPLGNLDVNVAHFLSDSSQGC